MSRTYAALIWAMMLMLWIPCGMACNSADSASDSAGARAGERTPVKPGAVVLLEEKVDWLKGKKIGLVTNHTARVGEGHLLDTLIALGAEVQIIFAPEHGFRGEAEAGALIENGRDSRTGIPVISLYGPKKMPDDQDLAGVDVLIFDIQDVGVRFYTYLSTLIYCMDACARNDKALWVLDRPNPNGWYVGGPVLEKANSSFVGLHEVPVVYGMTLGEYARMANTEKWLASGKSCRLEVIPVSGYRRSMRWSDTGLPWIAPSPNLPDPISAEFYPVLCWYEGAPVSVGRGTDRPFMRAGAPWHTAFQRRYLTDSVDHQGALSVYGVSFRPVRFVPKSIAGKAEKPLFEGEACFGVEAVSAPASGDSLWLAGLQLLQSFYLEYREQTGKTDFFRPFFRKLSGTQSVENDIIAGKMPEEIQRSWKENVTRFQVVRKKYLIYPE